MKGGNSSGIKVFLVDDHPIVREGVRSYLSSQGSIVVVGEASDGNEALRKAKKLSPDVIVLDVNLPSLDGGELAKRLRQVVPKAKLLAFSIHDTKEYVVRMARCGVHGYVMKDEPPEHLLDVIRHVFNNGLHFPSDMTDAILAPDMKPCAGEAGAAALTDRERQVLRLLADGLANKEVARKLGISVRTAETHREHLSRKLKIGTVAGLTKYAIHHGLTSLK
ncbi:MAG TPA: DNA-binding response regulator [Elusimicrobia bacterium]|nr:DNA-binding response regulator [Elusimicrobiota bacterium]HBT61149.1 DNA-binding response regulator [Elusimicrobiota bacterium]